MKYSRLRTKFGQILTFDTQGPGTIGRPFTIFALPELKT